MLDLFYFQAQINFDVRLELPLGGFLADSSWFVGRRGSGG